MIVMVYVHDHECEWAQLTIGIRPQITDGAYLPVNNPVCIQTGTLLRWVETVNASQERMAELFEGDSDGRDSEVEVP